MNNLMNLIRFEKVLEEYYRKISILEDYEKPVSYKEIKTINQKLKKNYEIVLPIIEQKSSLYWFKDIENIYGENWEIIYQDEYLDDWYNVFLELNSTASSLKLQIERILNDLNNIITDLSSSYFWINDYDLIQKIKRIQHIMEKYSCWAYYKDFEVWGKYEDEWEEYKRLFVELDQELAIRRFENKNKFQTLQDFFHYYYWNLNSYQERRNFINSLYVRKGSVVKKVISNRTVQ